MYHRVPDLQPWPSHGPAMAQRSCRRISGWHYAVRGDPGRLCLEPAREPRDPGAVGAPKLGGELEVEW
jgi:hypothetical protein